jgi:hypothetical protein
MKVTCQTLWSAAAHTANARKLPLPVTSLTTPKKMPSVLRPDGTPDWEKQLRFDMEFAEATLLTTGKLDSMAVLRIPPADAPDREEMMMVEITYRDADGKQHDPWRTGANPQCQRQAGAARAHPRLLDGERTHFVRSRYADILPDKTPTAEERATAKKI